MKYSLDEIGKGLFDVMNNNEDVKVIFDNQEDHDNYIIDIISALKKNLEK